MSGRRLGAQRLERINGRLVAVPDIGRRSPGRCTGMRSCAASPHVHGCYADTGDCDNPIDHISGSTNPLGSGRNQSVDTASTDVVD